MVNGMEITECRVFPVNHNTLKANVTFAFNHCWVTKGIKVVKGSKGLYVQMVSKPNDNPNQPDKKYIDLCFPLSEEMRVYIQKTIMAEYYTKTNTQPENNSGGYQQQPSSGYQNQTPPPQSDDDLPF